MSWRLVFGSLLVCGQCSAQLCRIIGDHHVKRCLRAWPRFGYQASAASSALCGELECRELYGERSRQVFHAIRGHGCQRSTDGRVTGLTR